MLRRLFAPLFAAALLAGCAAGPAPELAATPAPAAAGAVSAADPRAQAAGEAMLAAGGNAVDAAIATMLALSVVEPQSSGIGGGGFLVRGEANGTVASYDGRETAPAGADARWFLGPDGTLPPFAQSVRSGLSVGVPGNIALAAQVHEAHGKLPWAKLFDPAIRLAREGFHINPRLHGALTRMPDHAGWSEAARTLYFDGGAPRPVGSLVVNPALAETFATIAAKGPDAFYQGALATEISTTVAEATPRPRPLAAADLAAYRALPRDAVCGAYRGYRVCGMGPPSSGGIAVLQILGMLERFDLKTLGLRNPASWHLFLEAQRLAYADRELYIADPAFAAVPTEGLLDPAYLAQRSALIAPDRTMARAEPGRPRGVDARPGDGDEPEERGTSHIAAVDGAGTMVSYTSTIEGPFGSGLMAGGFYLNNELTDFSRAPEKDGRAVANRVEAGKRPRSSMAPTVVWDPAGHPVLVVGAAGGPTIPVQTARSIIGIVDFGLSAEDALGLPFIMGEDDWTMVEPGGWLEAAIPALAALGHRGVTARPAAIKAGAILRRDGQWTAARDPRLARDLELP